MPAAIGAALIGELALGATAELVVGYAVVTVGTMALQYGVQALLGSDKRADHQVTVRQAVAPRRRVLGQAKLGGVIFALETLKFNDTNKVLYRGAVHCVGPVQILQYWFGDVKTGLGAGSGGFVPDDVYQGKVVIEGHAGTEDQPASAALLKLPYWTDAMRLKGLCYSVVVATGRQRDALGGKRDRMDKKLEGAAYRRDIEHFVARDEIERRIDKAVDGAKTEAAKGLAEVALQVRDLRKIGWGLASAALLAFGRIVLAKVGPAGR
ncbi:hypothetical protein [Methylobacterium fujisawaense]